MASCTDAEIAKHADGPIGVKMEGLFWSQPRGVCSRAAVAQQSECPVCRADSKSPTSFGSNTAVPLIKLVRSGSKGRCRVQLVELAAVCGLFAHSGSKYFFKRRNISTITSLQKKSPHLTKNRGLPRPRQKRMATRHRHLVPPRRSNNDIVNACAAQQESAVHHLLKHASPRP